ncbi:MAG: acyl-CoA dehydratase activase [Oscillospiraceae bacterium]|nr:acyl-CoA dehydratase activase [Oscillospiraceae bacterium]
MIKIGIDAGSTTVKTVVLGGDNTILFRSYERHKACVRDAVLRQFEQAKAAVPQDEPVVVAITGSAGLGLSKAAGLPFVQEVFATAKAVRSYPDTQEASAVIELGGEDAKIIFFGQNGSIEERMNGTCAGGTGAFIDQMAVLLNTDAAGLDALAENSEQVYNIASRCGVFAKTDIQPILNQGGRREDVAVSVLQAVVDQTIAGLCQGRELTGRIVFLGGPLTFLLQLRRRFTETLSLTDENAVFPENADVFAALGAALYAGEVLTDNAILPSELEQKLQGAATDIDGQKTLPQLFSSEAELSEFRARHSRAAAPELDAQGYSGDAYLGIDAGSTTTKLVLITPEGGILHSFYSPNEGSPVELVRRQLDEIYKKFSDRVTIRGAVSTGYGEELIKSAFSLDNGIVETIAHLEAARHFVADVDFILDIGGQDVKCFKIANRAIDSIMLNEACSSGCGSFIETFARALGYSAEEFSQLGLLAKAPVDLGSRCTVFMNSSIKQAQKDGASPEDISAGLSISVVKNALYKVIRATSPDELGRRIVVQGGTFYNDAVLRAFELEVSAEVTRPSIAGLMGAYGAALIAKGLGLRESVLITAEQLAGFTYESKPVTCGGCTNKCHMSINTFATADGQTRRHVSGNRCSRPVTGKVNELPDIAAWKYEYLRSLNDGGDPDDRTIGIPFVLNMFENLPFWKAFFQRLGYSIKLSAPSSRQLYLLGQKTIPSDTVCYPAKLAHGAVQSLIDRGCTTLFYPCMPYNFDEGISDNHYNCPVVAYYPELLAANMKMPDNVRFLAPYFNLANKKGFTRRAGEYFSRADILAVSKKDVKLAAKAAFAAYEAYRSTLLSETEKAIAYARENGLPVLVVSGRPYHIDPEINHGINKMMTELGFVVVTEDGISHKQGYEKRSVLNQWTYQARMYNAARQAAEMPDTEFVQLVSFGCGTDAVTSDELRGILEGRGKLYTQLKIDDIQNLGAVRIRLRSLIAASNERKAESGGEAAI